MAAAAAIARAPRARAGQTVRIGYQKFGLLLMLKTRGYVTPGQTTFFQYLSSATDPTATVHADGLHRRLNPQAFHYGGHVGVLAEYSITEQRVARGDGSTKLTHRAWHVTPSVVLGGKPTFNGVTASDRFAPGDGHFGALELGVRVGQLTVDEDAFPTFPTRSH
jgi:phosphate-selective porin OprO/OprP